MEKTALIMAIFGKKGTAEKVLVPCFQDNIRDVMVELEAQYGGMWVYCESLQKGEGIKYIDGFIYQGFSHNIPRYSAAIVMVSNAMK